jgi:hypothetical protein
MAGRGAYFGQTASSRARWCLWVGLTPHPRIDDRHDARARGKGQIRLHPASLNLLGAFCPHYLFGSGLRGPPWFRALLILFSAGAGSREMLPRLPLASIDQSLTVGFACFGGSAASQRHDNCSTRLRR